MKTKHVINIILVILILLLLYSYYYVLIIPDKTEMLQAPVESLISRTDKLNNESLENKIFIEKDVYNSMREYLISFHPNESAVIIYGRYNKKGDYFNITSWKKAKIYSSNTTSVHFRYNSIPFVNMLGTIHTHPSQTIRGCKLSASDVKWYNFGGYYPNELMGIFCSNYTYMIFYAPTNESSNYLERYVYKHKN